MRKYLVVFRLSIVNALMYRANLLAGFASYTMFILVFFCLWRTIYASGGMDGLTLNQIVWYLCITEIVSFGANTRIYGVVAEEVKTGAIAYQLLRPYGYIGYQFAQSMGPAVVNTCLFSLIGAALGFIVAGPIKGYQAWTILPGLFSLSLGIALFFFAQLSIALLAFFIEEPGGLNLILSKCVMMLGTFIPVDFLPEGMRRVVKCLPFSYMSWAPARLLVGFEWDLFAQTIPVQLAYTAGLIGLCLLEMRAGRRAIQANGG